MAPDAVTRLARSRRPQAPAAEAGVDVRGLAVHFEGVEGGRRRRPSARARRDPRADRAERRGQDDVRQRDHRFPACRRRARCASTAVDVTGWSRKHARALRPRPHVPERPALPVPLGARERRGRRRRQRRVACRARGRFATELLERFGLRDLRLPARARGCRTGGTPARRAPRARHAAAVPAARRAGRRPQRARERRARRVARGDPRRLRLRACS